ncbi:MAG: hypothetical protein Q9227_004597 [Pyrenula ochraceoflavens]
MSDLLCVLPAFPTNLYLHLLPSLERHNVTTADLVSLNAIEIAKRTYLPVLDLHQLCKHVIDDLHRDVGLQRTESEPADSAASFAQESQHSAPREMSSNFISILDPGLNAILQGGFSIGHVTEVTGESGVGKSQILLTLLLSTQLLTIGEARRQAIYISTEGTIATSRLEQIIRGHPRLSMLPATSKPSLSGVHVIHAKDLETQDHILLYGLVPAIRKVRASLVVIDSIAANYRPEPAFSAARSLAQRQRQLSKLGNLLRKIAVEENVAVVVANQVSDRIDHVGSSQPFQKGFLLSSPLGSSPPATPSPSPFLSELTSSEMTLEHQQRFFTGWGDEFLSIPTSLKTPALGFPWSTQISCRIALKMSSTAAESHIVPDPRGGFIEHPLKRRRFMKLVFAPWASPSDEVEFEIRKEGVFAIGGLDEAGG